MPSLARHRDDPAGGASAAAAFWARLLLPGAGGGDPPSGDGMAGAAGGFFEGAADAASGAPSSSALREHAAEHGRDARATLLLLLTLIGCILLAYYVKKFRVYWFPESAGALLVGMVVGGVARLATDQTRLLEFSPEVFFFVLLPPIIFEAGYSLKKKDFFDNIGAICLYAVAGTVISCFVVGMCLFHAARAGLVSSVDRDDPLEALMFGALIAAVDPVATLSILGSADLQCNPLLYSLVFGESVLNDAIAISLFNVFASYYDRGGNKGSGGDGSDGDGAGGSPFSSGQIPRALGTFGLVSLLSILVGVALGLLPSYLYRHTSLSDFPRLETSLLFCFCYLCYSVGEALGLSGILALFVQGIVLAHYNSCNLSRTALLASEQIFATLATLAETAVFLYMGMSVFTEGFRHFDIAHALWALALCVVGRFANIFPLSFLSNLCRSEPNRITLKMQCVLWFAGLRGAIAFALAMNMPGPRRERYATTTLFICIFTTVVCGGSTDRVLSEFGMKQDDSGRFDQGEAEDLGVSRALPGPRSDASSSGMRPDYALPARRGPSRVYKGAKRLLKQLDDDFLKVYFGGSTPVASASYDGGAVGRQRYLGNYELGNLDDFEEDDEEENGSPS